MATVAGRDARTPDENRNQDLKLITFDFWNTLFLDQHEGIRHQKRIAFAHQMICRHHPATAVSEVASAFQAAHGVYLSQWESRKSFPMNLHFRELLRNLDLEIPEKDFARVVDFFESVLLEHPPVLINNAFEAVRSAAQRMNVGLISDTGYTPGRALRKILEHHELLDSFNAFSFSNETGLLKPNREAFHKILDELKIRPHEAVHIGDLEETDITGAKQAGMKAIKFIGANPSSMRDSVADAVIEDLAELSRVLERW